VINEDRFSVVIIIDPFLLAAQLRIVEFHLEKNLEFGRMRDCLFSPSVAVPPAGGFTFG
jgi:hypothetical protein